MRLLSLSLLLLAAGLAGCGPKLTCGPGTHASGSSCVADPVDAGAGLSCGPGTAASGSTCVALDAGSVQCGPLEYLDGGVCVVDPELAFCGAGAYLDGGVCLGGPPPSPTIWGAAVKVSDRPTHGGWQTEPTIAVDATGQVVVAWQADFGDDGGPPGPPLYALSRDQGATWTPSQLVEPGLPQGVDFAGDVSLASDHDGNNVYLAFTHYGACSADGGTVAGDPDLTPCVGGTYPGSVLLSTLGAGQSGFSTPVSVDESPYTERLDRPWLSVSPSGEVWVVYDDFDSGKWMLRHGTPAGGFTTQGTLNETLSNNFRLYQGNGGVAFEPDGSVLIGVQYSYRREGTLRMERWASNGQYSRVALLDGLYSSLEHQLHQHVQTSNPLPSGNTCVAYLDATSEVGRVVARPFRVDETFADPVQVSDPVPGSRGYLWMAQDENRYVHLLWLDNRGGQGWRPYSASSKDCITWTPNYVVSDLPFADDGSQDDFIGDFISLAARGGKLYAAWTDTRTGRPEIFVASAPNPLQ